MRHLFDETMHCSWCRAPFATARGTDCQHDVPARRKGTVARVASTWPQLRRHRAENMFAVVRGMIR